MLNDPIVLRGTRRGNFNTVSNVLRETQDPNVIVERLYLTTLSRYPNDSERAIATNYLRAGKIEERTEDLQFVLLNKLEFIFN